MISLQGNCIDTITGTALTSGNEVWHIDSGGVSEPLGQRLLPGGTLQVPNLPGEHTYYISAIDDGYGGYGGLIDVRVGGVYPSVTVTNPCTPGSGEGGGPVPTTVGSSHTLRMRRASHDCGAGGTDASLNQLVAPMQALQTNRMRSNLSQAQARLRTLRSARSIPRLDVQGVPLPAAPQDSGEAARSQHFGVYVLGLGDYLRQTDAPRSEFSARTTALSVGADYRLNDQWVMGGNVGASDSRISFVDSASKQTSRGNQITTYASWSATESTYVSATLSYEASKFKLQRDDGQGEVALSAPTGHGLGASVSVGRDFMFGALSVGPYVRWDHVRSSVDSFDEAGSDSAVSVSEQRVRSNTMNLGAQTQLSVPVSWGIVLPYVRLEITRSKNTTQQAPTATLINGNTTLLLPTTADTSATYGNVAVGVSAVNQAGVSWFADYESSVAQKGYRSQRIGLGLRVEL